MQNFTLRAITFELTLNFNIQFVIFANQNL